MGEITRVLVVDDNPINREVIHEILDDKYDLRDASNAEEALRCVEQCAPRVVLLDVRLPGIDGYSLCRLLRRQPKMEAARIIMVSAKVMPEDLASGLSAGADAYLTKPFDEVALLDLIHGVSQLSNAAVGVRGSRE